MNIERLYFGMRMKDIRSLCMRLGEIFENDFKRMGVGDIADGIPDSNYSGTSYLYMVSDIVATTLLERMCINQNSNWNDVDTGMFSSLSGEDEAMYIHVSAFICDVHSKGLDDNMSFLENCNKYDYTMPFSMVNYIRPFCEDPDRTSFNESLIRLTELAWVKVVKGERWLDSICSDTI